MSKKIGAGALAAQLEAIKAEAEQAKNRLIELLGAGKRMEGGGVSLVRTTRAGNVDYQSVLQDLMPGKSKDEIAEFCSRYRKEGTETFTVRIAK